MHDRPNEGVGSWKMRRRFMWIISGFCMWTITYILLKNLDTRVAETAVMSSFLCLGGIVGSYVFGAAWQDIRTTESTNRRKDAS